LDLHNFLKKNNKISYKDSKTAFINIKFATKKRCTSLTKKGFQCSGLVLFDKKYCFQHKNQNFTFIDLFSGAGGLSAGLIKSGLIPLLCIDKDLNSCTTLKNNHKQINVINKSVKVCDFFKFKNTVDFIVGGSPCQSFSQIGLKKGLLDSNGIALLDFIKIIFLVKPKLFIIENVRGLISHNKGKTLEHILFLLSQDNLYKIETKLIDMVEYGIPQKRVRFFIIGSLKSLKLSFFPLPNLHKKQNLEDVLTNTPESKGMQYSLKKKELFKNIPEGGC